MTAVDWSYLDPGKAAAYREAVVQAERAYWARVMAVRFRRPVPVCRPWRPGPIRWAA